MGRSTCQNANGNIVGTELGQVVLELLLLRISQRRVTLFTLTEAQLAMTICAPGEHLSILVLLCLDVLDSITWRPAGPQALLTQ